MRDHLVPASALASVVVGAFVAGAATAGVSAVELSVPHPAAPAVSLLRDQPSVVVTTPVARPGDGGGSSLAGGAARTRVLGFATTRPLPVRHLAPSAPATPSHEKQTVRAQRGRHAAPYAAPYAAPPATPHTAPHARKKHTTGHVHGGRKRGRAH